MTHEDITRICAEKGLGWKKGHFDGFGNNEFTEVWNDGPWVELDMNAPPGYKIKALHRDFSPPTNENDLRLVLMALTDVEVDRYVQRLFCIYKDQGGEKYYGCHTNGRLAWICFQHRAPTETRARAIAAVLEGRG